MIFVDIYFPTTWSLDQIKEWFYSHGNPYAWWPRSYWAWTLELKPASQQSEKKHTSLSP